jgi:hypothetical protein
MNLSPIPFPVDLSERLDVQGAWAESTDKPLARCASSVAVLIAMFMVKSCALGCGDALIAGTSAESRGVSNIWV